MSHEDYHAWSSALHRATLLVGIPHVSLSFTGFVVYCITRKFVITCSQIFVFIKRRKKEGLASLSGHQFCFQVIEHSNLNELKEDQVPAAGRIESPDSGLTLYTFYNIKYNIHMYTITFLVHAQSI